MKLTTPMKMLKNASTVILQGIVPALLSAAIPLTHASTVWNGPTINFSHTSVGVNDQLTSGVALTRGNGGGLYNAVTESFASGGTSPSDTKWAVGSLANFNTLTYGACPLESGERPPNDVGTTYVVHLINEDIYLSIKLTSWTSGGTGFAYTRSTPAAVIPPTPTISITNPVGGAVFSAPANVSIGASAAVSSGTVTNVQFFTNGVLLRTVLTAPFNFTNALPAGAYALKAVATASGISATSAVVNITVDAPPAVTITNPASGAVFSAPANITIRASASDGDGTVTNVQFLVGPNVLTNISSGTFTGTTNNLAAASYTLTAIASDNFGIKNSNSISISVVTPVATTLSGMSASAASANFQFSYLANVGLNYVIQRSTNLVSTNWLSLLTNTAVSSTVIFTDNNATNSAGYYRVGRLPNP